jgi:hypothetical protein
MKKSSKTTREEFWKEQVAKFRQSGESRRQYCLTHKYARAQSHPKRGEKL